MVEQEKTNPGGEKSPYSAFFQLSRKILLAGIGAAVLAQEEVENFVTRMVERGEIAEKDAKQLAREIMERREKMMREWRAPAAAAAQPPAATKADIEALTARIAELNRKIDDLTKKQKPAG